MANDYPDTPWWSNLLAVLITFIVTLVGTVYAMTSSGSLSAPGSEGVGAFIKDTLVYIPHALLLYGVIADMLTNEGVYSIGSLIGLLSLVVHVLFKFIWKGTFEIIDKVMTALTQRSEIPFNPRAVRPRTTVLSASPPAPLTSSPAKGTTPRFGGAKAGSFFGTYTGCDIQGFGWAHSPYAPQTLVIIATIFSYYGLDLLKNRGAQNSIATIVLGLAFFGIQAFLSGDCSLEGEPPVGKFYQVILSAAEGLFTGGISYSVVQAYFPERLPSSTISPFPRMTPNMLKDGKFDKDGNPWVCVGGVCYPDMSSAESRKAFAAIVKTSTGNGRAAVSEDCPAA